MGEKATIPGMAATTQERPMDLERPIKEIGTDLAARMPRPRLVSTARVEQRMTELLMKDPALRAALFRFVDVRPACASPEDLTRHLHEFLADAESKTAQRATTFTRRPFAQKPIAAVAGVGVKRMAQQFIVGQDAKDALPEITKLWRSGVETTVDLLGEATVSEVEADRYMQRCEETLRALASAATKPGQVNLSVKVSALTPLLRPTAPERGIEGARPRLEHLLRVAKEVGAHLHVDMESFDTREAITELTLDLLSQPEFADGPSAGIVLQAYLTESPEHLDHLLDWAASTPRKHPFVIRLVKGAYWDHEVVQAAQNGWAPPVFTDRRDCDRNFEALTKRLIDATPTVRVAIASHNLRSISHAAAYADAQQVGNEDLEFQILRGLGDDTQAAIAATGRQVRAYCPVGDLVAGMAYLVRRLLENTANDSFLAAHASGTDTAELLEAP
jgi:RHH-type proline utilization regulon transcriptional repressor/proline dehydrogenase/delta 1-pyrroline-5-carboxylate dehydrogenase